MRVHNDKVNDGPSEPTEDSDRKIMNINDTNEQFCTNEHQTDDEFALPNIGVVITVIMIFLPAFTLPNQILKGSKT